MDVARTAGLTAASLAAVLLLGVVGHSVVEAAESTLELGAATFQVTHQDGELASIAGFAALRVDWFDGSALYRRPHAPGAFAVYAAYQSQHTTFDPARVQGISQTFRFTDPNGATWISDELRYDYDGDGIIAAEERMYRVVLGDTHEDATIGRYNFVMLVDGGPEPDFTVFKRTWTSAPSPAAPFHDVNGDGAWDPGLDVQIPAADIQDGEHDAGAAGLVIPPGAGGIQASKVRLVSGHGLIVGVPITSQKDVVLESTGGSVSVGGVAVSSPRKAVQVVAAKDVELRGTTLDGSAGVDITATQGIVWGRDAVIASAKKIGITAGLEVDLQDVTASADGDLTIDSGGPVDVRASWLESTTGSVLVTAVGDIDVRAADLHAPAKDVDLDATDASHAVFVDQVVFDDSDATAAIGPAGVDVVGTPAAGGWSY